MERSKAIGMVAAVLAMALAGCAGGGGSAADGFTIVREPADPASEPYVFRATVDAERYVWRMGDGRAALEGREVEHLYGFQDGTVTVTLRAIAADGQEQRYTRTLVLGSGEAVPPAFRMDAETDWAEVGEPVRFSGAGSTHPDGDPLLFQWNCFYREPLIPVGIPHEHPFGGGTPFGGDQISGFEVGVATESLPEADRTVDGDLCDEVAQGHFTDESTVEGAFMTPGHYRLTMVAKHPARPSVSGFFDFIVSPSGSRPDPVFHHTFDGSLLLPTGGALQDPMDGIGQEGVDRASHRFSLELPAKGLYVNLTGISDATQSGAVCLRLVLERTDDRELRECDEEDIHLQDPDITPPPDGRPLVPRGNYRVDVQMQLGLQAEYTGEVFALYDMNYLHLWEPPH